MGPTQAIIGASAHSRFRRRLLLRVAFEEEILHEAVAADPRLRLPLHGQAVLVDQRLATVESGGLNGQMREKDNVSLF